MKTSKKILVLTMGCNMSFFKAQEKYLRENLYAKDILDGKFDNVDYWTYTASTDGKYHVNKSQHIFEVPADDTLYGTYEKTYKVFKLINEIGLEYDYIFRTNCSTYVNVEMLKRFVDNIKNDKFVFSGSIYCTRDCTGPFEWCLYGVGNSLLLSKFWVDVIVENHVSKYKDINTVRSENENYYKVDDNTIGLVINSYAYNNNIDMYNIWQSYNFPVINKIPKEPYKFIAIPFRVYTKDNANSIKDREEEAKHAMFIHNSIKNADMSNITFDDLLGRSTLHIIHMDRGMHSIISRTEGNIFLDVMALPRYLQKLKEQN